MTLSLTLLVGPVLVDPDDEYPVALRLARDTEGRALILTAEERFRGEKKAREIEAAGRAEEAAGRAAEAAGRAVEAAGRAVEAAGRAEEAAARQRAEERVAELEKTLAAKGRRT